MTILAAQPRRVVAADDSPFQRRVLADGLTAAGFEVVGAAADGDEALRLCHEAATSRTIRVHVADGRVTVNESGGVELPLLAGSEVNP